MNGINPSDGRHGGENRNTESGFYYTYAQSTQRAAPRKSSSDT